MATYQVRTVEAEELEKVRLAVGDDVYASGSYAQALQRID